MRMPLHSPCRHSQRPYAYDGFGDRAEQAHLRQRFADGEQTVRAGRREALLHGTGAVPAALGSRQRHDAHGGGHRGSPALPADGVVSSRSSAGHARWLHTRERRSGVFKGEWGLKTKSFRGDVHTRTLRKTTPTRAYGGEVGRCAVYPARPRHVRAFTAARPASAQRSWL